MSLAKSLPKGLTKGLTKSPPLAYGAAPRVNLLPPAERERRERVELIRRWGAIAVAAAVLVVLAVLVAAFLARSAEGDLQSERTRTTELTNKLAAYRDVSAAIRDKGSYEAYRTQAMASDVAWKSVIGALQAALPSGASVSGFDAVVGDGTSAASSTSGSSTGSVDAGAAAAAAPSGTAVTVSVQVTSRRSVDQKAMIARFAKVPGVLGVDLSSLSSATGGGYSSTTAVYFDDSVLSGQYAKAAR